MLKLGTWNYCIMPAADRCTSLHSWGWARFDTSGLRFGPLHAEPFCLPVVPYTAATWMNYMSAPHNLSGLLMIDPRMQFECSMLYASSESASVVFLKGLQQMHRQMQNSAIDALTDEGGGPVWMRKWQSVLRNSFELLQGNTLDLEGDHASYRNFSREEQVKFSAFAARSGLSRTRNDWQNRRGVPDSVPGMQAIQYSYHPPVAGRGVHTGKQMLNLEMAHRHGIYVVAAWPLTTAEWDAMSDEERAARNAHAVLARRVREHELAEAVPVIADVSEAIVPIDDDTRPTDLTDWLADAS